MSATAPGRKPFVPTFESLLVYHLWREFPRESIGAVRARAVRVCQTAEENLNEQERAAWDAAIRDRAKYGCEE